MRRRISTASGWRVWERELRIWLADQIGVEEASIMPDASLADTYAVDSLDLAAILSAFEADFGLDLSGASCRTVATFGDFAALVRERAAAVGAGTRSTSMRDTDRTHRSRRQRRSDLRQLLRPRPEQQLDVLRPPEIAVQRIVDVDANAAV